MPKKILFVDDDADWHLLVDGSLRDAGHEVVVAKNAGDAMRYVDEDAFDLLVLDLDLGDGENGLELAEFLEVNQPSLPIIFYSGMPLDEEARRNTPSERTHVHLQKGSMEELLKAVQNILASKDQTT